MARRGQCRCGLMLTFRRTRHGYKMRCPSCGAVVRLQVPAKGVPPQADHHAPLTWPIESAPPPLDDIDVELLLLPDAPEPEFLIPGEPAPPERRTWVILLILGGVVLLTGISGLTWWLLR